MRPVVQRAIAGIVKSPWVMLNYLGLSFNVGLYAVPSSGSTLTYTIQYSPGGSQDPIKGTVTRVAAVATAIIPNHGLTAGATPDSVVVQGAGVPFDGTFDVASVVDANTITYAVANSGPLQSTGDVSFLPMPVFTVTGMSAQAARATGSLTNPAGAVRANITANTGGTLDLWIEQGLGR